MRKKTFDFLGNDEPELKEMFFNGTLKKGAVLNDVRFISSKGDKVSDVWTIDFNNASDYRTYSTFSGVVNRHRYRAALCVNIKKHRMYSQFFVRVTEEEFTKYNALKEMGII